MTEARKISDSVKLGIFDALTAAEDVAVAFAKAKRIGGLNGEQFEHLSNLFRGDLTAENFSRDCVATLRDLADSLEPAILDETQTWFVHDECNMSGGHEESATTEKGDALIWLRSGVQNLADRLSDVVRLQEAVSLSDCLV